MIDTLIVLAKQPRPGRVKTRLTPPLTPSQAASVAGAALLDTLAAVDRTPARRRLLAFAGDPSGWLPDGWDHYSQPEGGLDVRIAAAFAAAGAGSALLVGMDTPHLQPADLLAFDPDRHDAAFGAAPDGGYWALGFRDAATGTRAVPGVPMSQDDTGAHQVLRLAALGLRVRALPTLTDIDTIADLTEVAALMPRTSAVARAWAGLRLDAA
ncbi:TIGR04282 family arsenosugar biosynthesis glycosyltransferase [Jatrophihabitans fulvus]